MKKGDKVRIKYWHKISNKNIKPWDIGTIVAFRSIEKYTKLFTLVGVQFDRDINGHSCGDIGKYKSCAWIIKSRLTVIK